MVNTLYDPKNPHPEPQLVSPTTAGVPSACIAMRGPPLSPKQVDFSAVQVPTHMWYASEYCEKTAEHIDPWATGRSTRRRIPEMGEYDGLNGL